MPSHCIYSLFQEAVRRWPDNVAVASSGLTLKFCELDRRANNLAWAMARQKSLDAGSVVAVLSADRTDLITAILAALRIGCVFVPLDPLAPRARQAAVLRHTDPDCVIADSSTLAGNLPIWEGSAGPDIVDPKTVDDHLAEAPAIQARGADDLCCIYYTSGSSSVPRGVAVRLKAIRHFIEWEIETLPVSGPVRVSQLIPPVFDAFLRDMFVPLCTGGAICVPRDTTLSMDSSALADWLDNERIELVHTVPSVFRSLLRAKLRPDRFLHLRHVLLSGEVLSCGDVSKWISVFGSRIELLNLYGQSETTMVKLFHRVQPGDEKRRSIPIGKPMRGATAIVIDSDGRVCPPGIPGELYIRTPYRALGYYKDPESTRRSFVPNPFSADPADIVYKTGDLVRESPNGSFEFMGRIDEQIKIGGVRVDIAEIESGLRALPGVRESVVAFRETAPDVGYLCAWVATEEPLEPVMLRAALARTLPRAMLPSRFVFLRKFERTGTGKIDRNKLPGTPESPVSASRAAEPQTPTEIEVAEIWGNLLGEREIGIDDDFFELGGHSLLAMQVLARVSDNFGVELSLTEFLSTPTIRRTARLVEAQLIAQTPFEVLEKTLGNIEQAMHTEASANRSMGDAPAIQIE